MVVKTIYLARHGESTDNALQISNQLQREQADECKLSMLGQRQSELLATRLEAAFIEKVISSDIHRAKETALIINKTLSTPVLTERILREVETDESFSERKERSERIIKMLENMPEKNTLVVAHGGIIKSVVAHLLYGKEMEENDYLKFMRFSNVMNCGLTTLKLMHDGRWKLVTWNEFSHLKDKDS